MSEGGQEVTGVEVLGFASWITSAAAYGNSARLEAKLHA